ncbi:MAG: ABC transporter substrate-binding protein [Elusimicrobia bacterium]|nr:ABC transporter substrate-binding protein [Elusimicrobiota bacterium]
MRFVMGLFVIGSVSLRAQALDWSRDLPSQARVIMAESAAVPAVEAAAVSGPATEQLKERLDGIFDLVRTPPADENEKERRLKKVRAMAGELFHWGEMAKLTLGRHWDARTADEKAEFVALFSELMERAYVSKIDLYGGEPIRFLGEEVQGEGSVVVKTVLITRKKQHLPIHYVLKDMDGRWRAYDLSIEGISLADNYRVQFSRIIVKESFAQLLAKLRSKRIG